MLKAHANKNQKLDQNIDQKLEQLRAILARYPMQQQSNFSFNKLCISRFVVETIFIFLLQFIGSIIILLFAPLLWIASGTACGFIFLKGPRIFLGICLGNFIAFYSMLRNLPLAIACATCLSLQPICILKINYWFNNETLVFRRLSNFFYFIASSALITALVTYGLVCLMPQIFSFFICWSANFLGTITFSIALVSLDMYFPEVALVKENLTSKLCLFFIVNFILFVFLLLLNQPLFLLSISILISFLTFEITRKYGWCACVFVIFLQSLLLGLVNIFTPLSYSPDNYFIIQSLLMIEVIIGLMCSIIVYNHREC